MPQIIAATIVRKKNESICTKIVDPIKPKKLLE
jgi:hypothetical protein